MADGNDGRPRLLVVGGASLDVLHVRGVPVRSPGGAGLYTALAAARQGLAVTMLAPVPEPLPPELARVHRHVRWIGPTVPPEGLPRFEIAYDDAGDVTLFREHLGHEPDMRPTLVDLVADAPGGLPEWAYCVPFLDARLQRAFVDDLQRRGCRVATNTYLHGVTQHPDVVRGTFARADVFFCNEAEAHVLLGDGRPPATRSPRLLFVTRGARGATVVQGDAATDVAAVAATVVDPTGAGDTFCGTVLAGLAQGLHPLDAAASAVRAAAEEVGGIGPARLWEPPSPPPPDRRVAVDPERVDLLAQRLAAAPDVVPSAFVGEDLPAVGDPGALEWFFAATLQQFGFWYDDGDRWVGPMRVVRDGRSRKGSDHLWASYLAWARRDPGVATVARQAALTEAELAAASAGDDGRVPLPDLGAALELARAYGRSMVQAGWTPATVVAQANASDRPTAVLVRLLDHVGGYREDPLRKKSALLAAILRQRPEGWLRVVPGDDVPPIVDYHVQRTCLRTGVVVVRDAALERRLVGRRVVTAGEEDVVRRACASAVEDLAVRSGRSMGAVDWFLFQMRHRCPEETEPVCARCPADPACAHRVALFQPVRRTTAY